MIRTAALHAGSEFDDFLFAPIGDDRNGLLLTVVSLLARLNLDPWTEAAQYGGLPSETAARKLAALIAAQPCGPVSASSAVTTAARLIALLPRRAASSCPPPVIPVGERLMAARKFLVHAILIAIYLALLLLSQFLVVTHESASRAAAPHAPATLAAPARAPPTFGK